MAWCELSYSASSAWYTLYESHVSTASLASLLRKPYSSSSNAMQSGAAAERVPRSWLKRAALWPIMKRKAHTLSTVMCSWAGRDQRVEPAA